MIVSKYCDLLINYIIILNVIVTLDSVNCYPVILSFVEKRHERTCNYAYIYIEWIGRGSLTLINEILVAPYHC